MKPRRVIVTIEMDTTAKLASLRDKAGWWHAIVAAGYRWGAQIHKVQVGVVKPKKGDTQP